MILTYSPAAVTIAVLFPVALCIAFLLLYLKCRVDNAELSAKLRDAVESGRKNTEFFTNMTHELKTPISVILGAIQLIEIQKGGKYEEDANLRKNLNTIRINCYRLTRLVNNLLDTAKTEAGYMKFKPANCNLDYLLYEIVQSVMPYAANNRLTILYNKPADPVVTAVDIEKMERIMLNLLSNAIKFTPPGGTIIVSTFTAGERIYVSVKDSGAGIPPEDQEEVFGRFRQAGAGPSKEGCGIGLSLVKSFVALHKGNVRVVSEYGKGCEFIIDLPAANAADAVNECNDADLNLKMVEAAKIEFSGIHSA